MNFEIECDNCGSHSVRKVAATTPPLPNRTTVKMSEIVEKERELKSSPGYGVVPAIMQYHQKKYRCENCGNETATFMEAF